MSKLSALIIVLVSYSSLSFATADSNPVSECVMDKYFTKADALRIKVDELTKKENSATNNKSTIRIEKDKAAAELKKMREKKKAYDVLKKENFFSVEEGLKSVFPEEFEACQDE